MTPHFLQPTIVRLGPDTNAPKPRRRPGAPLPHAQVAAIGRLVEETPLSFRAIAQQTGVSLATVSRLSARHGWERRHAEAPALVPTAAQRQNERFARLSDRILGLAEEAVEHLDSARIAATPAEIHRAMRLLRMARKAVEEERKGVGRKRRR